MWPGLDYGCAPCGPLLQPSSVPGLALLHSLRSWPGESMRAVLNGEKPLTHPLMLSESQHQLQLRGPIRCSLSGLQGCRWGRQWAHQLQVPQLGGAFSAAALAYL